jgi:hypothetical protein
MKRERLKNILMNQLQLITFVRIQSLNTLIHRIINSIYVSMIQCFLLLIPGLASAAMVNTNTPPATSVQQWHPSDVTSAASTNWIPLLDADLTHWELWMGVPHHIVTGLPPGTPVSPDRHQGKPLGLNNDPKHVFSVRMEGGEPVLCISGEIFGGLTTVEKSLDLIARHGFNYVLLNSYAYDSNWRKGKTGPDDYGSSLYSAHATPSTRRAAH